MAIGSQAALAAPREFDMASACLSAFQIHWSLVSSDEAGELAPYGGRLLAIWPAPMLCDSLPSFHAEFGGEGTALRTGNGHFLFWITLPGDEPDPVEFVRKVARSREVYETRLRWPPLLPHSHRGQPVNGMRNP